MDPREQILARLYAIIQAAGGFNRVVRNNPDISDIGMDAIVLIDGGEEVDNESAPRRREANGPKIVRMTPSIGFAIAGDPETIGATANAHRRSLVKTILEDATLLGLVLDNEIEWTAFSTDLHPGAETMLLTAALDFSFAYMARPSSW